MTVINLALFGAALWCAAVIGGWAAVGTNTDRPTRTGPAEDVHPSLCDHP